jgi:hypothetical protein
LQRSYGNSYVGEIFQAKLAVSQPGDKYEQEADRVAEQVMRMPEPRVQRQPEEEEKKEERIQTKPLADQITPLVQRQVAEEEKKKEKEKPLQTKAVADQPPTVTPSIESRINAMQGGGQPLDPATRTYLEPRFGRDFSQVRVHTDTQAEETAKSINARAFTVGQDIAFGSGQYAAESQEGRRLLAHEATHVVQQSGGVQRRIIQRVPSPPAIPPVASAGGNASPASLPATEPVDAVNKKITIPNLRLPPFKIARHKDKYTGTLIVPTEERNTDQINKWTEGVKGAVDSKVEEKLAGAEYVKSPTSGRNIYFLRSTSGAADFYLFGEKKGIKSEACIPYWDPLGRERLMAVDHRLEIQLGGKDEVENMELLDASANSSSGSGIRNEIESTVAAAVAPYTKGPRKVWDKAPNVKQLRTEKWEICFTGFTPNLPVTGEPMIYWKLKDIMDGEHIKKLRVMTAAEIEQAGLRGSPTELVIFTASRGGTPRRIAWPPDAGSTQRIFIRNFYPGFNLTEVLYTPTEEEGKKVGLITGDIFKDNKLIAGANVTWELRKAPGIGYGGYINDLGILAAIKEKLQFKTMSPIQFMEARLDDTKGLYAVGQILPTMPLFRNIGIDLVIEGEDVRLRKLFSATDFSFPGPIKVTNSSLELSAGIRSGLGIKGGVQFEIERVGKGSIGATARAGAGEAGFALEGSFEFDPKLFDKAKIDAWYRDNTFGAKGQLIIKEGKIKGIKSASIDATYREGRLDAAGTAELSVPGVKTVNLALSYSEQEGLAIGGSFELADNIPGIHQSGSGQVLVKQKPDGSGYDVTASGKAVPRIPGVTASIDIAYDNGAMTIEGTAAYEKGMLNGSILVGVTNRPVGADGKPAGEPGKKLTLYGGGAVTLQIAPWLQATAGIRLLPNGEVEVTGEIRLPKSLDIFPEKKLDKNIFTMPSLDIPIVGLSVLGKRVGIFASIGGGLDLSAGIGPGQLQELGLSVTYNPAHEEQTHVAGKAKLHIPAHAGLRLYISGSIGAGLLIVSAQGGLEIGGSLGLEGALDAGVQVDWTPTHGLKLDAVGEIYVEPKLRFDITGFVKVELDLLLKKVDLYSKRWELAAFEYGSGLRFGVKLPVHYEEGKPFDISLNDVQFQIPEIKPKEILSDLIKKIT